MTGRRWGQILGLLGIALVIATTAQRKYDRLTPGAPVRSMSVAMHGQIQDLARDRSAPHMWLIVDDGNQLAAHETVVRTVAREAYLTIAVICARRSQCPAGTWQAANRRTSRALDTAPSPSVVVLNPERRVSSIVPLGATPEVETLRNAVRARPGVSS